MDPTRNGDNRKKLDGLKMNGNLRTPSAMRSSIMVLMMLLAALSAPAVEWRTEGEDDSELRAALTALLGPIGTASAADFESDTSLDPADHITVMTSTEYGENIRLVDSWEDNDDEEDDWCMGDFFMINVTRRFSYFAVCWGSEENPGPVTIAALEVQYLGGITLEDFPVEGMSVPGVPLPIATVFATSLVHMIEFEDTGTPEDPANTSGNGVFDFTRSGEGLSDFEMTSAEDVHAGVDLSNLVWEMTDDGIEEWSHVEGRENEMGWNFTIEATDVDYDGDDIWWLLGGNDDVVERIAYTFHLGVSIDEVTDEVIPWWTVTLDPVENKSWENDEIPYEVESIGEQQNLTWSGVRVATDFKYDQTIDGWDFHTPDSLLMVESIIIRGSFTFGIISDFMDEVSGEVGAFDETMAYDADEEDEVVLGTGDVRGVNKVTGTNVEWRHNYQKVPDKLHWVDEVELTDADGNVTTAEVTFQLHASEAFAENNDDVSVAVYIALGGTIYPAAEHIFHDPGYSASINIIQLGMALLSGEIVGLQFVVVTLLGVLGLIGITLRKRKARNVLAMVAAIPAAGAAPVLAAAVPATVAAPAVVTAPMQSAALPEMLDLDSNPPPGGGASGPLW